MDFKTLMQTVDAMGDEELLFAEQKIHEERRSRDAAALSYQPTRPGGADVLIELAHLANGVRESLRQEMSMASEPVLASVLEQIKEFSERSGDERVVTELLRTALTAALILEARCEVARRLDSVR